jgi:hypothetical protein
VQDAPAATEADAVHPSARSDAAAADHRDAVPVVQQERLPGAPPRACSDFLSPQAVATSAAADARGSDGGEAQVAPDPCADLRREAAASAVRRAPAPVPAAVAVAEEPRVQRPALQRPLPALQPAPAPAPEAAVSVRPAPRDGRPLQARRRRLAALVRAPAARSQARAPPRSARERVRGPAPEEAAQRQQVRRLAAALRAWRFSPGAAQASAARRASAAPALGRPASSGRFDPSSAYRRTTRWPAP